MQDNKTYWFVFIGNSLLVNRNEGKGSVPLSEMPPTPLKAWTLQQELPEMDGHPCKTYKLEVPPEDLNGLETIGLRESWNVLPRKMYNMASKASELLYWDSNTKFCGMCGAPMKRDTVISKRCTNCGKEVWPQVSPAIIVRIRRGDQILLVNAKTFRRSEMYGLVAGFLETGETLEDCVRREVMEEVHLKIRNLKYFGSQAWPYPCGVMIGYTADYESGEIELQEEELNRAGWFGKNNMPAIPDKMSIARMLIDDFLEES